MFSCKTLVLLLVASAAARPHINGHHARHAKRTCRRPIGDSVASSSVIEGTSEATATALSAETPVSSSAAPEITSSIKKDDDDVTSSTKVATSKAAEATTATGKASATSSTEKEEPTKEATGPAKGSLMKSLFPLGTSSTSWSTGDGALNFFELSDETFKPTKAISTLSHPYVSKAGKKAMKAHYPKGSYTFTHQPQGGISFYAPGPIDLTDAREVTFGYSVYFPDGFDFVKGGKLPGIFGGNSYDQATGCSGGRRDTACFSARLMWRTNGAGEMYTYLPPGFDANDKICKVPPFSECNETYGASIARGSFEWATGAWTTVSERVKLNTPGKSDGELQLWVNGKSVINLSGLVLRDSSAGRIRGIQMQTFFGGSGSDWASTKDQDVFFSDFSLAILEKL